MLSQTAPFLGSHRRLWLRFAFAFGCFALAAAAPAPAERNTTVEAPLDSFARISDDESLTHADVRAIVQDHEGFMWFGLRLGGLMRYDGYEIKVHQHNPANPATIGNPVIWSLLVDHKENLWIGTEGGLDRYDKPSDTFIHYRHDEELPNSLPNNVVTSIAEDSEGHIWVATRNGLSRLDDAERGIFTTFRRPQVLEGSLVKDTFRSITEDPTTGLLWLGASDGMAVFDPRTGAFASYIHDPKDPDSISRTAVNKVVRDPSGRFWALTEDGLNSFVPTFRRVEHHSVQQPHLAFHHFFRTSDPGTPGMNFLRDGIIDRKGRLWIASRGGLELFDARTENFTVYRRKAADPTSLSDDIVHTVFEDRSGNLWVGTYAGGVNRLHSERKPFRIFRHDPGNPQSLSDDRIVGIAFDTTGHLWAATTNGLNRFDGTNWTRFLHDPTQSDSLPSNDLSTIAAAPNGDVWTATNYGGLYRYDGTHFHSYPTSPNNLPMENGWQPAIGPQVNSILPDGQGGAWLGARSYGLDHLTGDRYWHFRPQDGTNGLAFQPTTNPLVGILIADTALWFATETSGLVRLDLKTQTFKAFMPPAEHPETSRSILCIASGSDGTIWLGTADGLVNFDPKVERFIHQYSTQHGIENSAIMTIVADQRGHLWLGTANGLVDFDPKTEKARTYQKPDGLPSNAFAQRAGAMGPDGRVFLGTRDGLVAFAPGELQDDTTPPPVVITELRWIGPPPTGATGSRPDTVLNVGSAWHVPPGQLGFTLKFSALDFTAPEKNRFRFRLEGWDDDWTYTSSRERSATYTSLPPGQYTFRVQGSNADQAWNEKGDSLTLVVEPHLWQTLWFRVGLITATALVVAAALQWRLRSVRRRNDALEEQVSVRTSQLQEEIEERQRAEAALRESHAELETRVHARTAELAQTNLSLQKEIAERRSVEAQLRQSQKMEAIGQLAGGVAHDFNNLLTVILGQGELLSEPQLDRDLRDAAIRDIKEAAQRATNLTRQLLVFSRRQPMNPVAVDLNQVVTSVSKLLRHVIGEHIELDTQLWPGPLGVVADPGMLEQVLLNMAVNARDVMPRGGRLTISTGYRQVSTESLRGKPHVSPGDYARFSVSDTGSGIPEHILPQIFEPFFTTKESGKGTGLGLAISQGIVQQHRGWIDVETAVGRGTTFHVYLPTQAVPSSGSVSQGLPPPPKPRTAVILLAEDESAVRTVVKHVLTRQGHRVIEAASGTDALAAWAANRGEITLVITDIVMPGGINGHELAAQLVRERPGLPVVTMSGYDPSEFNSGRTLGAQLHLRKPFTTDELQRVVERALR